MGSDAFKFGKLVYKPTGAGSNYVVVLKVESGASVDNPAVMDARREAELTAPQYFSRREQKDHIDMLRSCTEMNERLGYSILEGILPDQVVMHKQYKSDQREQLESITTMLFLDYLKERVNVKLWADLRSFNYSESGVITKFKCFFTVLLG